ncbi:hypothetical protein TOPH_00796 [Tolypocladium ophioglossoides CBS 100239]|uniref:Uncharacterized protein n=1 Tax=Tolypocladium ophioglossoides (strain CBS 100239) TaxID=1163406 RepID=A0A0L0NKD4_TOLOC|nr:hypothetical protein TOPH_00796 [Tolypocladium ophioglossoides CBS 100239]
MTPMSTPSASSTCLAERPSWLSCSRTSTPCPRSSGPFPSGSSLSPSCRSSSCCRGRVRPRPSRRTICLPWGATALSTSPTGSTDTLPSPSTSPTGSPLLPASSRLSCTATSSTSTTPRCSRAKSLSFRYNGGAPVDKRRVWHRSGSPQRAETPTPFWFKWSSDSSDCGWSARAWKREARAQNKSDPDWTGLHGWRCWRTLGGVRYENGIASEYELEVAIRLGCIDGD